MNRKLQNRFVDLLGPAAFSVAVALAMASAAPLGTLRTGMSVAHAGLPGNPPLAAAAAVNAEIATAAAVATALQSVADDGAIAPPAPSRPPQKTSRRARHALVMPYFSFGSRG